MKYLKPASALIVLMALLPLATAQHPAQPKPADPKVEKAKLASLTDAYAKSKAAYKKSPKDSKAKSRYVSATVALATATMTASTLGPKVKYPGALRLYREALATDPKNKEAKENKDMIESIYKSMGRPIPKS